MVEKVVATLSILVDQEAQLTIREITNSDLDRVMAIIIIITNNINNNKGQLLLQQPLPVAQRGPYRLNHPKC